MGDKGRELMEKRFTINKFLTNIENEIFELL
jgi:hypothetical protein